MKQLEEEGYSNLTVAKVVDKADLSIGAYMHHFSQKEKLLIELIETYHKQRTEALEARFEGLQIRTRRDIMYFLKSIMEIQIGYFNNISNEFFMAQRTNELLQRHGKAVSDHNRERSRQLYRNVFGNDVYAHGDIAEIIDDFVNLFVRGIGFISVNRDKKEIDRKIKFWLADFCDKIEAEIQKTSNADSDSIGSKAS